LRSLNLLIVGRSREIAESIGALITGNRNFNVQTRILTNGHADPVHGVTTLPDILLLHCSNGQAELKYLADNGVREQIPLVVCGPVNDTEAMRLAMRAGARDYLPENLPASDLISSLERIRDESSRGQHNPRGKLIVVTNGKGGSGASFVASNLAHSLVVDGGQKVLLMDLDLQFGGLCRYLDLDPKMGIIEALEAVTEMDEISADAYTSEHHSGLKLLAAKSNRDTLPKSISIDRLESLLNVYLSNYDVVVVDAPSHLDAANELFFENADQVLVVVQQFLPNVQNASRMVQLLMKEIGVPKERLAIIVNRFAKNAAIELDDIKTALRVGRIFPVPNQFKLAAEAINAGLPVTDLSSNSALAKSFRRLQARIADPTIVDQASILSRAIPNFLRR